MARGLRVVKGGGSKSGIKGVPEEEVRAVTKGGALPPGTVVFHPRFGDPVVEYLGSWPESSSAAGR